MKNKTFTSLPILFVFCLLACNTDPLPKTFLIPSDYEGTMRVVYEDKSAVEPKVEKGRLICEFPKNGILILNEKLDDGRDGDFYLADASGNRTKVTQILDPKDRLSKKPSVVAGMLTVSGFTYSNDVPVVRGLVFKDYHLYNHDTTEISSTSPQFDSLTHSVVAAFRAKK